MHRKTFLRLFLIFLAGYLAIDALIHLFNIRLLSVDGIWPTSALIYARLINAIYASFVFLASLLLIVICSDLTKYKKLLKISVFWAVFHGVLLITLAFGQNFSAEFVKFPSLLVWIPFYNQYLMFEGLLSFVYVVLVWNFSHD